MRSKPIDALIAVATVIAVLAVAISRMAKSRAARSAIAVASPRKGWMRRRRFQVALTLFALVAVATMSVGVTLALYSNKPTGETNTFTAGTVTLTNVVTGACTASTSTANNMAPGDSTNCTLATTYAGSLPGYMAVDVYIATKSNAAGGGSPLPLYNPTDGSNEAQITVSSINPTESYVGVSYNFGTAITCATGPDNVSYAGYTACYLVQYFLVSATALTTGTTTFTVGISLPSGEPNTYQGGSAVVVLAAHAVQSKNNAIDCVAGGLSPTAGNVCTPAGTFAWS